ncbi:carotenoid oxygenase family protein [Rhodococcus aetherivorans]|uniref:carotenoid oxygenase family protein n=1 Tax=Rhodococcus aetherivorans TaxID=191292 RepID=UPI00241C0CC9|nr:carotenoid oxygenase family protein [Rhodococcus aetherivorans]WFS12704.1 carotenoid oxygenase family protein [Rhodococcus aetherivorans]
MTTEFPDVPALSGWEEPLRFEGEVRDLEIIGEVPAEIDGAFFRVAPDPVYPNRTGTDIFFNGDGNVGAFRIKDGNVDFRQRYVQTDRFLAERKAGRSLFGAYRNPFTDDPSVAGLSRSTANTNVVVHNGTLWALKEDSLPIAMDPETLETKGFSDFGGKMRSRTFTAHPKIDPHTGEMICFGYAAKGEALPDIAYYVISASGEVTHEAWFEAPYASMIHDMAITDNYVVFPVMPLGSSIERMKRGGMHFQWEPEWPVYYGVIPRRGNGEDVRWFRAPNAFPGHTLSAHEKDGRILLDISLTLGNVFPWFPPASGDVTDPATLPTRFARVALDLRSTTKEAETFELLDIIAEFPHIDDRFVGTDYRHGFFAGMDLSVPLRLDRVRNKPFNLVFNSLVHGDAHTGKVKYWTPGETDTVQEPVFVPRSANAAEGEGFVMLLVNRLAEGRSDLVILDSTDIEGGPLAVAKLPMRMKFGLHGNWADASTFTGVTTDVQPRRV